MLLLRGDFMNMESKLTRFLDKEQQAAGDRFFIQEVIESGDFRVDIANRSATLNGEPLYLSSDEFDVLLFLVNHKQHMVTPHTVLTTARTQTRYSTVNSTLFWTNSPISHLHHLA